jgi:polyvinyl alcohol dehydrogenase (cytochrome)
LASLGLPATASADWPLYGHDLSNSRNAGDEGPPPSQVASMSRAWTFNSPTGDFTGTPVVADGVVVAGDHAGWVYALNAVNGKQIWSKHVGPEINGTAAVDLDAPGGPTAYVPVAAPGRPRLVALSLADGAPRWDTVLTAQPDASVYGSPVFWKGSLYIGTSGPNTDDAHARGSVVSLDQANGKIRWQTFTVPPDRDGAAVWSTPAIDPATGRLYVGTGNNYHPPTTDMENSILALDTASGRILGHYQATPNDSFSGGDNPVGGPDADFGASPNLFGGANGQALVGAGQKSGVYWALDRATLKPAWNTRVGPGGPLGGILGSTAFDGAHVYGADTIDGSVFALGRDGSENWESPDAGGAHLGAASIAHGVLYTADETGVLTARDPATGSILTKISLGGPSFGGISAAGAALFVAVGTGPLPEPAPQSDNPGSIVAFGDTSTAGPTRRPGAQQGRAKLKLSVRPRRVRAGRLVRLRFRVTGNSRPVRGATIRFAGRRLATRAGGRATLRVRFHKAARRPARASRSGFSGARATVRVLRAR